MRVALVVPGGVDRSGSERVIPALLWLIERLAHRHEVVVFALEQEPGPSEWELLGARVVNLGRSRAPLPGLRAAAETLALRAALSRHGPFGVVHAFWAAPCGALAAAATPRGVPFVLSLAGGELVGLPGIDYGAQHRPRERMKVAFALRRARAVTAASAPMVAAARQHGVAARLIPLGVPLNLFHPPYSEPPGDPLRVAFVGGLSPVKDPLTALGAVAEARSKAPPFELSVAGEGPLLEVCRTEAARLGLAGSVRFHGLLRTQGVRDLLGRSHLLLVSSLHEAGPVALVEAAASGVPAVGTAVGHLVEGSPDRSLAVPAGDAAGLGEAIAALLRDPEKRLRMGKAARAWAEANDADATAAAFESLYAEVARG